MPEEDPSQPDLSHVTTDWLIRELFNRHDAILLARETRTTRDDRKTVVEYGGGLNAAIGLARRADRWLDDASADDLRELDE